MEEKKKKRLISPQRKFHVLSNSLTESGEKGFELTEGHFSTGVGKISYIYKKMEEQTH